MPDRPTIDTHFSPARCSPFSCYLDASPPISRPPPFRSVLERLGLSDAAFKELLTAEIDEVLLTSADERQRARSPDCEAPPTSAPLPSLPILSKDDCLVFFCSHGYPMTGALLRVYRWAANLGIPHFNFECDIDWNDLSFLDVYD